MKCVKGGNRYRLVFVILLTVFIQGCFKNVGTVIKFKKNAQTGDVSVEYKSPKEVDGGTLNYERKGADLYSFYLHFEKASGEDVIKEVGATYKAGFKMLEDFAAAYAKTTMPSIGGVLPGDDEENLADE